MKVAFTGPSVFPHLSDLKKQYPEIEFRPPAGRGDIYRAVGDGAAGVALIDGVFNQTASVWHKEILFAVSSGVTCLGAASMGALRALECRDFGMVGVGQIYRQLLESSIVDDEAVAVLHGPAELDWLPLSKSRVDCEATFNQLLLVGAISQGECDRLFFASHLTHYGDRNYAALATMAIKDAVRAREVLQAIKECEVHLKLADALEAIEQLSNLGVARCQTAWEFSATSHWDALCESVCGEEGSR